MSQPYTLARDGQPPLKFTGEHLAGVSTRQVAGKDHSRWYEIDLYRTDGGKYVAAVVYQTCWQGEHTQCYVLACDTAQDAMHELSLYDPLRHVVGFPPGAAYAEKQRRLEDSLRRDWAAGLRDLYGQVNSDEFAETIP